MLADAVSKVGADRILYGTDYPGYDPAPFIESVLNAKITDDDKEKIFYGNAVRLLGITP
jgi:predicted TIM-barrel fold metal-dependent hydrolase